MTQQDRRKYPRVSDDTLALELKLDGFDVMTHSLNVSASGVYCKIDKPMPLMSRVNLMLMIPDVTKEGRHRKSVTASGVIVREHPVIIDGKIQHYDVAIFFDDLSAESRELISHYVTRRIPRSMSH